MSWSDLPKLENDLVAALDQFDWATAGALCRTLVTRVYVEGDPLPLPAVKRVLSNLRRKRRFSEMTDLAEALMRSGHPIPLVRRQYAQSLIDRDMLLAPELVLSSVLQDSAASDDEQTESRGLMGRIYKQLYVNHHDAKSGTVQKFLERSLSEYLSAYRLKPRKNLWHGINVVALICRAKRDGLPLLALPDPAILAKNILATIEARERNLAVDLPAYDVATALEALVALGRLEDAESRALEYCRHPGADFFEIASTYRQFVQLWQLNDKQPPGSTLLPILGAAVLKRHGGLVTIRPEDLTHKLDVVRAARKKLEASEDFERVHGLEGTQPLLWVETGLERARSVARIERLNGEGFRTGWVVRSTDLFLKGPAQPVLITNSHVIDDEGRHGALLEHEARVRFERLNQRFEIDQLLWTSPRDKLDTSVLSLKCDPAELKPIPVWDHPITKTEPAQRLYIIGHPRGGDLQFSFYDNRLIACNDHLLHYRTPTEAGSSGSPVFESSDWRAIGLHHKGDSKMPRLDGPGEYAANEGIGILAIREAIRAGRGSVGAEKRHRVKPKARAAQ